MSMDADEPSAESELRTRDCERQLHRLYMSFHPVVLRKATLAAAGNVPDAWDGVQHAFIKAWEHLRQPEATNVVNWQGWLIKTAVRHVLFARQRSGAVVPLEDIDCVDDQVLLEDRLVLKEAYQKIIDAIGNLTERQRQALILVHFSGCSTAEAATDMGVSSSTVRNLIHQARTRLAATTGEES